MKQSLQLKLGQQLTMTPQLQQAIRLLQLSTLELQVEVQQALDSNLMLEINEEQDEGTEGENERRTAEEQGEAAEVRDVADASAESVENIPDELPVDSGWDDIYESGPVYNGSGDEDREFVISDDSGEGLQEHLMWQLEMSHLSDQDRTIALMLIDSISDDGYLTTPLEEVRDSLADEFELEIDEIEAVLQLVQTFDPPGVGARDLRESLLLQLRQLPGDTEWRQEATRLVAEHLALLASHDYTQLKRRMKLDDEALAETIHLIESLNPRPGTQVAPAPNDYIVPDVFVRKYKGTWRVELNVDVIPRVSINNQYANLVRRADNSSDNQYLKNQLQEARWFLKSLQSRNETLLKVATAIVERQRGFLEYGDEAMKPLVLRDVAEAVEMHESTISRVTTQKYMHTPRGIFEFKYFFSSQVATSDGSGASATAIRAMIKKLVAAENPGKPLSDSKIASILTDQGIHVARRTVAKYREALSIPPSNERKRLA